MKYVLVSDIHGNAPALQAVVDSESAESNYVVLGDIHGLNAYPAETVALLTEIEPTILLAGNHDKAIFHHDEGHVNSDELSTFEQEHTVTNLTDEECDWMESLPFMDVWQDGDSRIAAAHAYPWPEKASGYEQGNIGVQKRNVTSVASTVSDDYDYVFHGHTHTQYDVDCSQYGGNNNVIFINPGSLGWDGTYSIVNTDTTTVQHKSVEFDTEQIEAHIQDALHDSAPNTSQWF
jgi:predicted phosphodiesterase